MSIVGGGDIANVLKDREGFTFFASGVSNSQEIKESEYEREYNLLQKQDKNKRLVYFGSLSVFYSKTRYAKHKLFMEGIVKRDFPQYTIIRLGNIAFGKNPNTIINFFRNKKKKGEEFEIQDVYRYVIEKEEFLHWMDLIPKWNCEMNLTGQFLTVEEIIKKYV